jgi:hypothetical protein
MTDFRRAASCKRVAAVTTWNPAWACLLAYSPEAAWIVCSEKTAVLPERRLAPRGGVGEAMESKRYLTSGDVVEVTNVGSIRNRVAAFEGAP